MDATLTKADTRPQEPAQEKKKSAVYAVSQGVSYAILSVLGMGLLLSSLGNILHLPALVQAGVMGQKMLAPALGVGVAMALDSTVLTTGAALIAATVGSNAVYFASTAVANTHTATHWAANQPAGSIIMTSGQPVSAVLAAVVAVLVGNYLTGKTALDMLLVPFAAVLTGTLTGLVAATYTTPFLNWISEKLADTMSVNPFLGAFIVSFFWFAFLMTPASSAALAIAVMLDPLSGGAALVGTTAAFVMYTVMGYKQNDLGANVAQTIVTPKVQFANMLKSPLLFFGPALIAGVSAMVAVGVFELKVPYAIAGLGLNSLIAPLALLGTNVHALMLVMVFGVLVPGVAAWFYYFFLKKAGLTKENDLHLDMM
ncbi:PTS sugar transporter subunit IIC [Fructobacillus sp. CRL 2054]|uniref:PTS sugar transporter subunit IIC n=1 Tax=Fructobacillus sp. CRL 2054 TaxID=2763007 RepID=UPI0023784325|nr:PTS sugar transporter subunit IIC [Fructobacillus sp. CRL 2054]MDD9138479.1 PTS sugar transporter subunit IIC [Fructobacillus sp. CRL 2054]